MKELKFKIVFKKKQKKLMITAQRKTNWQNDIAILNAFINPKNQKFNFETIKNLTKSKSRIQFNLIYYRVFEPPTDGYHSIINSGYLKYINLIK